MIRGYKVRVRVRRYSARGNSIRTEIKAVRAANRRIAIINTLLTMYAPDDEVISAKIEEKPNNVRRAR